ncbi:HlyD family efflux transporter periplasmic adaptor subunit [Gynuella sunshinyii]|uniref:Multidrug resistance efflux pump n=1 Tax=Gynuella sunshinyii YC6258 TaxID=1445510 RepID=A0A0C5VUU6_9GAMM|nr:HlyD family efflux transporter periplasmic adaptor subunit [Gynuella sunshinyii]AJQ94164.1 multidrug resistance efflux pump [Gynuella sunshinyii YC6258]
MSEVSKEMETTAVSQTRRNMFLLFFIVVILAGGGSFAYWYFISSKYISTDNAYTNVETAQVTPAVGGIVTEVKVNDTQQVKQGDVLVIIDNTDASIALAQAAADLELARRRVQGYQALDENLTAQIAARKADKERTAAQLDAAKSNLVRARLDFDRRKGLVNSGSVSAEDLSNAQNALTRAMADLKIAESSLHQSEANYNSAIGAQKANAVQIINTDIENNPEVLAAKARYEQAQVNLDRTVIYAPISGVVAKRQVQVGRRVQIGEPLMTLVPTDQIYVDANFKEVELSQVKPGQIATLTADIYGEDVVFRGVVSGFSGGTGSAFSLIPAQNATGNWIKVVQRLPVRIELDANELSKHPLRVGLSMEVKVHLNEETQDKLARINGLSDLDADQYLR